PARHGSATACHAPHALARAGNHVTLGSPAAALHHGTTMADRGADDGCEGRSGGRLHHAPALSVAAVAENRRAVGKLDGATESTDRCLPQPARRNAVVASATCSTAAGRSQRRGAGAAAKFRALSGSTGQAV